MPLYRLRHAGDDILLPHDRALVLGRGAACDIRLHDPWVSRRHATVEVQPEGVRLIPGGGANGTYVNGAQLTRPVVLLPGDWIRVGRSDLHLLPCSSLQGAPAPPGPTPSCAAATAIATVRDLRPFARRAAVVEAAKRMLADVRVAAPERFSGALRAATVLAELDAVEEGLEVLANAIDLVDRRAALDCLSPLAVARARGLLVRWSSTIGSDPRWAARLTMMNQAASA